MPSSLQLYPIFNFVIRVECNEMKKQASLEAQRTIAEAELIKAASQEELEAQRIYAETARLEAESLEVLAQVRAKLGEPSGAHVESPALHLNQVRQSDSPVHGPMYAPEVEPESAAESEADPALEEPASKSPKSKRSRSGSR